MVYHGDVNRSSTKFKTNFITGQQIFEQNTSEQPLNQITNTSYKDGEFEISWAYQDLIT